MLVQTNSYVLPSERRAEHARLMRKFRQTLNRLGCQCFEVLEQVGPDFTPGKGTVRFVQVMRFRDRQHYRQVQQAERGDSAAQELIRQFCELVDLEAQRSQSLFVVDYYSAVLGGEAEPSCPPECQDGQVQAAPPEASSPPLPRVPGGSSGPGEVPAPGADEGQGPAPMHAPCPEPPPLRLNDGSGT